MRAHCTGRLARVNVRRSAAQPRGAHIGPAGALVCLLLLAPSPARAEVVESHTSRATFLSALTRLPETIDFESMAPGEILPNPADLGSTHLSTTSPWEEMKIVECYHQSTPSGALSLGLTSLDEAFLSGDQLTFDLETPALAFGLFVIGSPGDIQPGDLVLETGTAMVANDEPERVLPDGGEAFFLGLVVTVPDIGSDFNHITLRSHDPDEAGLYLFNVDDILFTRPFGEANLVVTKIGPPHAEPGHEVTYTIVVVNMGPDPAYAVELDDPTPPGLDFLENAGHVIDPFPVEVSMIPPTDPLVVRSTYLVPKVYAGPVFATNTIFAYTPTPDPFPGMESAIAVTVIDPGGDRDGDHLSNADERTMGTDPHLADTDGDGMIDGHEVIADTDPAASNSVLAITGLQGSGTGARIEWQGGVEATQLLESRPGPSPVGPWTSILTNHPPTPVQNSATDTHGVDGVRYYRIRISP